MLSPYPPSRRSRRLRAPRGLVVLVMLAIVLAIAGWALFGPTPGTRGGGGQGLDLRYAADAAAQRRELAKLRAQVDEQELRLRVLESRSSYRTLDGTLLPAIPDPASSAPGNMTAPGL